MPGLLVAGPSYEEPTGHVAQGTYTPPSYLLGSGAVVRLRNGYLQPVTSPSRPHRASTARSPPSSSCTAVRDLHERLGPDHGWSWSVGPGVDGDDPGVDGDD